MAITTDDLSGVRPALRIRKTVKLNEVEEQADYGALWAVPKAFGERSFQLQGSFGLKGKRYPVFATLNPNPEKGGSGHEKPALHVFAVVEGDFHEIAVGFKKEKDNRTFYTGETNGSLGTKAPLAFWAVDPAAPDADPEGV
jgi:hypothetical protein